MSATADAAPPAEAFHFPVSFAQQRLWFLDRLEPDSSAYNVPLVLRLSGSLDLDALGSALDALVARHEALRTTFAEVEGEPSQLVHPPARHPLEQDDLSDHDDPEAAGTELALAEIDRPFDLTTGPLFRSRVVRLAEREHLLVLTLHHIVVDAWSLGVLRRDLSELYRAEVAGRSPQLPALEVQYGDFAVWQREWFQGERLTTQLAHWRRALEDVPSLLELPTDRPRPPVQSDRGGHVRTALRPGLEARLEALAQEEGATLFMLLLAAYAALLGRYSGQERIVVGTPIANRQRLELEPVVGFFANTLALPIDLAGDPTVRELLRRVRETVLDGTSHQDLPFEQLVAELNPSRSLSHSPLFQVLFQLHLDRGDAADLALPGLEVERVDLERGRAKFDLGLTMRRAADGLHASAEYSADLFDPGSVERMLGHLKTLLEAAVADPDRAIASLPLLTPTESAQIERWNETTVAFADAGRGVHELVEQQVARTPDAPALVFEGVPTTYAELDARANRLARHLRARGVGRDVPVGVALPRSPALIASVLAVLKAGGGYLPLDPSYPRDRLRMMLEDARPPVVLTETALAAELPEGPAVVCVDEIDDVPRGEAEDDPGPSGGGDALCYVLFTSGSTGRPKGVAMPHRVLTNLVLWQREHGTARPDARTLQFASLSFDVASQEIFSTLAGGGTLVLVDDTTRRDAAELLRTIERERVERLFVPYAVLQHLAETALELDLVPTALREVITAGEALQITPAIRSFFAGLEGCVLDNQYGPTEAHVVTSCVLTGDPRDWEPRPTIGTPIANARIELLDGLGRRVPVGVVGELHIGGPVLAHGYVNRPELTAERFVPDPFGAPGDRLYRTGDVARRRADGRVDFLGRGDDQVKVRGHRVELGEIEAVLLRHPDLREVAVAAREDPEGDRRLAAYVVPHRAPGPAPTELRDFVRSVLPDFMVPSAFVALERLPLGATGKIDRRALPAPDRGQTPVEQLVAPRTETERELAEIWRELLGLQEDVGVRDDFFDLGGHSMLAVRLMARVERRLRVKLPLATLFEGATIEQLAAAVDAETGSRWPTLVALRRGGSRPPVFLLHGHDGELLYYRELAHSFVPDQPVYGIQPVGLDGRERPYLGIEEMARHYADELRSFQPDGPYLLVGYCFSGMLAYEVGNQLAKQGSPPALLALIDAAPHGVRKRSRGELERAKLTEFLAADARGRGAWVARRARGLARKAGASARNRAFDLLDLAGRTPPRVLGGMEAAIARARTGYVTPASGLKVTLFRAAGDAARARDRRSDWARLAREVEIRPIVADGIRHDNIVKEPYVQALAAELELAIGAALAAEEAGSEANGGPSR